MNYKPTIASLLFIFTLFFSCSDNKDYVDYIPTDTTFVLSLNPKSLASKGNFSELDQYAFFEVLEKNYLSTSPALKGLWTNMQSSPYNAGIDIISPIYIFGQQMDHKNMFALIINMKSKKQFEENLKLIYQETLKKTIEFEKKDGYTFIKNNNKPFMAWNKHHFIYLAGDYGASKETYTHYFNHITRFSTPLSNTDSFRDFTTKSQDVNFWYTGQFIQDFFKNKRPDSSAIDLTKSSWSNYITFTTDGITYIQKFHPDAVTKKQLKAKGFWKNRINSEIFAYFPEQSYAHIALAIYPENARYVWEDQPFVERLLKDYSIDANLLAQSFEGEALVSVFDFETVDVFNQSDFFGKKESLLKKVAVPQFALAGRMKNDAFYKSLLATYGDQLQASGSGYVLGVSPKLSLWLAYENNILYITNNQLAMTRFQKKEIVEKNFLKSNYAFNANNPLFSYVNLDISTYSPEIQQFFYKQIPLGETLQMQELLKNFKYAEYRVADQYTKNGKLFFKENKQNSLETILEMTDKVYELLTVPQPLEIPLNED